MPAVLPRHQAAGSTACTTSEHVDGGQQQLLLLHGQQNQQMLPFDRVVWLQAQLLGVLQITDMASIKTLQIMATGAWLSDHSQQCFGISKTGQDILQVHSAAVQSMHNALGCKNCTWVAY